MEDLTERTIINDKIIDKIKVIAEIISMVFRIFFSSFYD